MISIIVPIYKAENFLCKCIDSIVAQTYTDWELLLINDGSPDNSGSLCDRYAQLDSRIHVYHKQNGGVSSARNLGLEYAKGDWITFVDADDWVEPLMFEKAMLVKEDCDLIVQSYREVKLENLSQNGEIIKMEIQDGVYTGNKLSSILSQIYVPHFLTPWAKIIRREILTQNELKFDPNMFLGEDTRMSFDYLACCKNVCFQNYPGYCYNLCEDSSTKYKMTQDQICYNIEKTFASYNRCVAQHGTLSRSYRWERQSVYVHIVCYKRWINFNGLDKEPTENLKLVLTNHYIHNSLFHYHAGDNLKRRIIYAIYDLLLNLHCYRLLYKIITRFI